MAKAPQDIDAYLQSLPDTSRDIIEKIRRTIADMAPNATEGIKYGMPTATLSGTNIVYYAAWKKHIGLYPIYHGAPAFERAVGPFRDKKETVRFPLSDEIPYDVIDLILTTRIDDLRRRVEASK